MSIPDKLYSRLQTSLLDYRTNPSEATDARLLTDETEVSWPWEASNAQLEDWAAICSRTRAEYETKLTALKTTRARRRREAP
jgi:hypothetical protein